MKIVFINPMLRSDSKRKLLPVGLAYVLTAVKKAGIGFDLIDMDINNLSMKDLEKILAHNNYDIYCFGCIVTGYRIVKQIAEIIKKINPGATIIVGNSVVTSIPEILLQNTKVDIGIIGEGDISIVELLIALEKKASIDTIKGIVFKKNDEIVFTPKRLVVNNIDSFGFPDWDIFELNKYEEYMETTVHCSDSDAYIAYPLNSARGCPFNCTFCYHVFVNEKYRRYSERCIIEEIKRLKENYNCNYISYWDELTFSTIRQVQERLESLQELDFKINWAGSVRAGLFRKEHLGLIKDLRDYGCKYLGFALESADSQILAAMKKRINVQRFIEQAKVEWEAGLTPLTSLVFGYPQETPATIQATCDVCERCNIFPSSGFLLPMPGTEIYEWAKQNGYIEDEVEYLQRIGDRQDLHINLTTMSDEEFVGTVTEKLEKLAKKLGLKFDNVLKTTTYHTPKIKKEVNKDGRQ